MNPRLIVIANPDGKRWQIFAREWQRFLNDHGRIASLELIPWNELLSEPSRFHHLQEDPAILRIESPGRDPHVARQFLSRGETLCPSNLHVDWSTLDMPKGWLAAPATLFAGFAATIRQLDAMCSTHPHVRKTAEPEAILAMFDKNHAAERLSIAGVPVPESISAPLTVEMLIAELRAKRWPVAYVKLLTGSSATGIIALHPMDDPPWGVSTLSAIGGRFFNTRQLQVLRGPALGNALTFLLHQGVCVQRGIEMAQVDGVNFDVRVIVIRGRVAMTIFRLSPQPMTNLHLGGRRGDFASCRGGIPQRIWLDAMDHCEEAANSFRADMVGVDLVFERYGHRYYILEVNAFGDFFPGATDEKGRSAHRNQMEEWANDWGWNAR